MTRIVRLLGWSTPIGCLLLLGSPSGAFAFTGLVSGANGIFAVGSWGLNPISLAWDITQNADQTWHYSYVFSHAEGGTSHVLLETSSDFSVQNIFNASGDFGLASVGSWEAGPSNPGMPGPLYGIGFEGATGLMTRIDFDSDRAPRWGDFYSKDDTFQSYTSDRANNTGFASGIDVDPIGPPIDGGDPSDILVPGSVSQVPEPSVLLLLGGALLGVAGWVRGRRR